MSVGGETSSHCVN